MVDIPLDSMRSVPEDHEFHTSRLMFWIVDGKVVQGTPGTSMSHLEMAQSLGWLDGVDPEEFFNANPRGFYLKEGNRVHFYRRVGFGFTESLKEEILEMLPQIRNELPLNSETEVYFGPKDSPIKGIDWPIERVGKLGDLLNKG